MAGRPTWSSACAAMAMAWHVALLAVASRQGSTRFPARRARRRDRGRLACLQLGAAGLVLLAVGVLHFGWRWRASTSAFRARSWPSPRGRASGPRPCRWLGVGADHLDIVAVEHAHAAQRQRGVERGLAAHGGQQRVGAFLGDDLGHDFGRDRLDIGRVGKLRIGHDRGRVGVDQDDAVALLLQRLAGLGAGIVELAGLTDDDGAGPDDQDRLDVGAFRHGASVRQALAQRTRRRAWPGRCARRRICRLDAAYRGGGEGREVRKGRKWDLSASCGCVRIRQGSCHSHPHDDQDVLPSRPAGLKRMLCFAFRTWQTSIPLSMSELKGRISKDQ
jgi:hypothetical protein